jgi:hypothetical protein
MRRLILPIAVCVLYAGAALGQTSDEARALVDKAIKAHGGEDSLKKYKAGILKNKGKIELLDGIEITQEVTFMLPDKFREEVSFTINGMAIKTLSVVNGDKVGIEVNGKKIPIDDKITESLKEARSMMDAMKLYPLREKGYELITVGEVKVNGKPAVGIRASKKGQKDVTIYFDKKTHLIGKVDRRTVDPMSGQEVSEERIIAEYQKVDGLPQPKRVVVNRDDKKFVEVEVLEMKFYEKLDDSMFTVP